MDKPDSYYEWGPVRWYWRRFWLWLRCCVVPWVLRQHRVKTVDGGYELRYPPGHQILCERNELLSDGVIRSAAIQPPELDRNRLPLNHPFHPANYRGSGMWGYEVEKLPEGENDE